MQENNNSMGLYIHIPFCSKKCDYCDFVSFSMDEQAQRNYLDVLLKEIDMVKGKYVKNTFNSIFIGGGTPSVVFEGFIAKLSEKIFSSFHFEEKTEFTIEVNPSSFTKDKLMEFVEAGVNRISVGIQCINSKILKKHGRIQSIKNVKRTFRILKESDIKNVNADVMIGFPGQRQDAVMETVKFLIKRNVMHMSVYSLQLEKHTALYDKVRRKKVKMPKEKKVLSMYNHVYKVLKKAGFVRYEVSNFAKPGFASAHNKKYWDDTNYLGLGVSAHSYIDGYRYYNTKRLDTYIETISENKSPVHAREYISIKEHRTERIMLSLRTTKGLDLNKFKQDFGEDLLQTKADEIKKLLDLQMVSIDDGFLRVLERYFYVSNSIIVDLL